MKIAVVGAGIFGSTVAIRIAQEGFDVDLFEKNSDILMSASGSNQFRLHRGYHYPRSKVTALSSKKAEDSFLSMYKDAVSTNSSHYYCIAHEGSKTSPEEFISFCEQCGLEYEKVDSTLVNKEKIDLTVKVREFLINPTKLRDILKKHIAQSNVHLFLNTKFEIEKIAEYDYVVNATYANLNDIIDLEKQKQYQFELCEKPVLRLPKEFKDISIVIMDGPFMCIDPYEDTDLHLMGNVVHALHSTNNGLTPIIPDEYKDLLDKGLVENPKITRVQDFLQSAEQFMPGVIHAEHIGSFFTIRTVLQNVDHTDERPTIVYPVGEKIINIFSGKMGNCVEAAEEALQIISKEK